jgi:hypothetical protein
VELVTNGDRKVTKESQAFEFSELGSQVVRLGYNENELGSDTKVDEAKGEECGESDVRPRGDHEDSKRTFGGSWDQ